MIKTVKFQPIERSVSNIDFIQKLAASIFRKPQFSEVTIKRDGKKQRYVLQLDSATWWLNEPSDNNTDYWTLSTKSATTEKIENILVKHGGLNILE